MTQVVGLRELRENLAKYIKRVHEGEEFIVMKKSEAVFKISSPQDELWEEVIDFTKLRKGGVDIHDLINRLESIDG